MSIDDTNETCQRGARRRSSGDAGLTIVELLVAMSILGIVLAAIASGAIAITRATGSVDVRTENVNQARLAVAAISRDIRSASPGPGGQVAFSRAEARHATFYARLRDGAVPVRIDLRIDDDDRLVETMTLPTIDPVTGVVTYEAANEEQRYVASFIFNTEDQPLLSYASMDANGLPVDLGLPVTDVDDRRAIELVTLDIRIARDRELRDRAQQITTEVRLPNQGGQ